MRVCPRLCRDILDRPWCACVCPRPRSALRTSSSSCFFSRISSQSESSFSLSWHLSCKSSVSFSNSSAARKPPRQSLALLLFPLYLPDSLREQASCLENVRRLSRNRGGVFREALFRHCRDTETTTASLPPKRCTRHSLNSSRFRGMTANILCHASRTWTTRHRLREGVLKGARCTCPDAAAELLALPLNLATLAEARHPPTPAPLHDIAQTRPGTMLSLEFTLTTNRCRSTEMANCNDPELGWRVWCVSPCP